jgi:hypothetical protein
LERFDQGDLRWQMLRVERTDPAQLFQHGSIDPLSLVVVRPTVDNAVTNGRETGPSAARRQGREQRLQALPVIGRRHGPSLDGLALRGFNGQRRLRGSDPIDPAGEKSVFRTRAREESELEARRTGIEDEQQGVPDASEAPG